MILAMNITLIIEYIAPLSGIILALLGLSAMIKPKVMSKQFGIPIEGKSLSYVISTGVRDVFMGLNILILYHQKLWIVLGYVNICLSLVAISDFVVVLKSGNKKASLIHGFGAVAVIFYGLILIFR